MLTELNNAQPEVSGSDILVVFRSAPKEVISGRNFLMITRSVNGSKDDSSRKLQNSGDRCERGTREGTVELTS